MHDADQQILDAFAAIRDATLELVHRLPEAMLHLKYKGDFTPEVAGTLLHIADGPRWWLQHCMQDRQGWSPPPATADQQTVTDWLTDSRNRLLRFFQSDGGRNLQRQFRLDDAHGGDGPWTGRNRVLYLTAHEVHHRGKVILALRHAGFDDIPLMPF